MTKPLSKPKQKLIIGISDFIDLPDAGLFQVPCKIDTGADTSAIHCARIRVKEINGQDVLSFILLDKKHPMYNKKELRTTEFVERKIRSSFGDYEFRYVVKLNIVLMGKKFRTSFTLSNREHMKYPVLLGRKFLKGRFLVDVGLTNLSQQSEL